MNNEVEKYIRKIRGDEKLRYALNYLDYREGYRKNLPHHDNALSYGSAQVVRMNINILLDCPNVRLAEGGE